MGATLRHIERFFLGLAAIAAIISIYITIDNSIIYYNGRKYNAVVISIYSESTYSFTFYKNGTPFQTEKRMAKVALLPTDSVSKSVPQSQHKERPALRHDATAEEIEARKQLINQQIDSLVAEIKSTFESVEIPANSPTYIISALDDFYNGKKISVILFKDKIIIELKTKMELFDATAAGWAGLCGFLLFIFTIIYWIRKKKIA